ncbi:hypothetical protein N7510_007838 [Penicillium lagena]|uniref:uncharacterized protein n=1 Tax=Penicillium lagena TaxID=94218 RepID=UPI0025412699|nr:uncharacterized protein N7510_007838 [Penicillium lagena]KAJ5611119.1 hypothetical protein N7510_007838 [Penicillium lagena]
MHSTFADYPYCYTRSWLGPTPLSGFGCAPSPFKQDVLSRVIDPSHNTASPATSSTLRSSSSVTNATNATNVTNTSTPSTGTSTTTSTPTDVSHHNTPPLSKGAISGIALGCFFFVCILITLSVPKSRKWIFGIFRFHRRPTDSTSEGAELRSNHGNDLPSRRVRPPSILSGPSVDPWDTGHYENY